jgi:hypothetical protein
MPSDERGIIVRWILAFGLLGLLVGCAASGVKVSEQQAQSFKVGTSTYDDVVATLGPPTSTTVTSDGTRAAASLRLQPQNFIPYLGPLVAGFDKRGRKLMTEQPAQWQDSHWSPNPADGRATAA